MNKIISNCIFIILCGVYISISLCAPWILSDNNIFLKNFVNHQFLNLLGIIIAITLASTANLHLEFNKIEEMAKDTILSKTRVSVKKSAFCLIGLFSAGFLLVIVKPLIQYSAISSALLNGAAILIVAFNILVLIDLKQLVFKIQPMFKMIPQDQGEKDSTEVESEANPGHKVATKK